MYVHVYVSPAAAVRAGKAKSGLVRIDLTEEQLGQLTPEEREELARAPGLGAEKLEYPSWALGSENGDPSLSEASFESVREVLRARLDRQREAVAKAQQRLREAVAEMERWLSMHEPSPSAHVARRYGNTGEWAADLPYIGDSPGLDYRDARVLGDTVERTLEPLRRRIQAVRDAAATEAKRRNVEEATAKAKVWLAENPVERLVEVKAEDGKLVAKTTFDGAWRVQERFDLAEQPVLEAVKARLAEATQEAARRNAELEKQRTSGLAAFVESQLDALSRKRFAEKLLPEQEALTRVRDHLFAALEKHPRYERLDGKDVEHEDTCIHPVYKFAADDAEELSAEQYAALERIRADAPKGAKVTPRVHRVWCEGDGCEDSDTVEAASALVSLDWHGWRLSREYALE